VTEQEFNAEVERRIAISEGRRALRYPDNRGIWTIGIGWNMQRGDTPAVLARIGVHDVEGVMAGRTPLTDAQIDALFGVALAPMESDARASLATGVFDALSDPRRFVVIDLCYNMGTGDDGWGGFGETHVLIAQATAAKTAGNVDEAHALYEQVGNHLEASAWFSQVGDRARRDVGMMRTGVWCSPTGDGSDAA
jgi:GH24 family phage-related lysozyme (muramidase)